ncbi:hypothetical protein Tco_0756312 [Tanacetum coccineum]
MSKKQDCTAMSSTEAEYVALSASYAQVMWMRTQLQDYGFNYNKIPLYCDSQSAIAISCNPVQHSRTKHIQTRPSRRKVSVTSSELIGNEKCLTPAELDFSELKNLLDTSSNINISQAVDKSPTHYPCDSARTFRVILFSIHNDEWKSFQCHHQTALRSYALSWKPCQGDPLNLPYHRYSIYTVKRSYGTEGYIKMEKVDASFPAEQSIQDEQSIASGQDTRPQGGKDDQDEGINEFKELGRKRRSLKDNDKGSISKITSHKEQALTNVDKTKIIIRALNTIAISIDLMRECHKKLHFTGEIITLKIIELRTMQVRS